MLIGIALAFLPGLLIWMVPTILNIDPPGVFATSVAMLALPMLPMFYTYAIFKRRLGDFEVRLNRLLAIYSVFIIYLLILSVALFFRASLETSSSTFFGFYFLVILAVGLAVFPLRDYFGKQINRFAYGSKFDPDDIFHIYATDIPAAMDRAILTELLTSEILPPLRIHQSMLLIKNGEDYESLFSYGVEEDNQELSIHEVNALKSASGVYLPPMVQGNWEENQTGSPEWVRLALMLERHSQEIGLWLFGVRDPDDFYSLKDINLLHDFAEQVAIAVESMRLFETVKNELIERQQAEETLQNYAGRLELLHGIDQAILEVSSSKEIAQAALNGLRKLVPFSMGSIIYFDLQTGRREVLALVGSEQSLIDSANIDLAAILSESIDLRARQVWSNNDVPGDLETKPYLKPAFEVGLRSVLSAPLMISGEINGLLNLGTDIVSGFKPEHSEIVLEVANTISVAIHSAMLLETVTSHSNELKRLSARLINIQEEERKHISIELHDEIGQVLTALTYNLAAIRRDMPPSRSPELIDRLSDSDQLVHQVMNRIRDISLQLRPSMLHDLGLVPTLRSYISDYGERMNLAVEFTADALVYPLDEDIETALYRVVQEGLTNVARHAHAKTVAVSLLCSEETVTATVEDDGIGFDTDSPRAESNLSNGTGLLGIRERLAPLGGEFEIHSNIGQGTVLVARIPVRKQDEED
ncbi:MAG: GAF domain-containing sensor histidine kinase [Candidatus Promineifilaceae bacterium]